MALPFPFTQQGPAFGGGRQLSRRQDLGPAQSDGQNLTFGCRPALQHKGESQEDICLTVH